MNLLCPNCQKMLTVPEQYAGQLMKCPMCSTNFTVPALPPGGAPEPPPAPAFASAPPPPPVETYGVKSEPVPAFAPPPAPSGPPPAPPVPAFVTSPPPAPATTTAEPPRAPAPTFSAGDYTEACRVLFDPKVLQWVPPAALVLVFVLHFFPWVGVYAGGVEITSQGAWGAAVGGYTKPDSDLDKLFEMLTADRLKAKNENAPKDVKYASNEPGFSVLIFFYLLPLFFLTLVATVGVVALPFVNAPLPPPVQQFLPWKWAIVAGLNALLLLFLLLQVVLPFSLENSVATSVGSDPQYQVTDKDKTPDVKMKTAMKGMQVGMVQRTMWWRAVILLHVLAAASAGLVYWVEKRGPAKPLPALEMRW